ncbi:BRCA1-associated ATM activator 1-like [Pecten maximus]|uniref:BRCA1-associated ATM activator 1-like n=1 Tax=Pecten maximus TaxID=6579 RepID=UPI0014586AA3|nr:BRCA1-associated ATM activator 1-like [Pecten maximus]
MENLNNSMEGDFKDNILMERISTVLTKLTYHQSTNRDDTCFQKFSDLLHSRLKSSKEAEQCGVVPFLKSILNQTDVETPVLVFSINLVGVLGQIPDLNKQQGELIETFLDFVLKEKELTDPSIGTEYFDTLRKLITFRSPTGKCLYVWKNGKELVLKCWQLLADERSLFLTSAVLRFFKDYFGLFEDVQNVKESYITTIERVVNHICQVHTSTNGFDQQKPPSILPSVLQLFQEMPRQMIETLERTVVQKLSECLAYIVGNMGKEICFFALESLLTLQINLRAQEQGKLESIVKQLPQDLVDRDILRSQKVCIKMLENGAHEGIAKDLLLCPLYIMTSRSDLVQTEELQAKQIGIHMNSKSTCIQIILNSLEIFSFTDAPQDALKATEELFALTHDGNISKIPFSCHLFHCKRIQQRCLELFIKNHSRLAHPRRLCWSILDVLKTDNLDTVTFSKCLDVLCMLAPEVLMCTDSELKDGETFDQRLTNAVQFNLCCIEWERRDTTLEFLTKLIPSCQGIICYKLTTVGVTQWMRSGRLCLYVYQALDDSNSYTRATALTCLQGVLESSQLTTDLLQQCDITMEDTEAFARRESICFITTMWNSVHCDLKVNILKILVERTSSDFDWEVKVKLVDFWEMLIDKDLIGSDVKLPSYANSLQPREKQQTLEQTRGTLQNIECFVKTACFDSLFKLLDDYDQSVCEKACLLLMRVMKHLSDVLEVDSAIPAKKRKTDDSETNIESVYQKLKALDLTTRLLEVSTTCDEYDKNPMSLLEDMLSYSKKTETDNESNALDCY